jgi:hypothetical protein
MKKVSFSILLAALLLISVQRSFCQGGGILFSAGVSSVRMDDLKNLQKYILSTYPVEGKITSSFPPYTSSAITIFKQLYDNIRVGGGYSYSTTGGKSSYSDYSGQIVTDMAVEAHRLEAYLSYSLMGGDRLNLNLYGKVDANLTSLTIESYYNILSYSNGITNRYRSISPLGIIGAELMYTFGNFALGMDAGYTVDLTGNLKDTDEGDPLLDPYDREKTLTTDWTGWNVHLSVLIWLKR